MANQQNNGTGTAFTTQTNPPTVSQGDLITAAEYTSMLEIIELLLQHDHGHDDLYYSNCECQCGGGGGTT